MIAWYLKPHLPWQRLRFSFLALLFATPSLAMAGVGLAFALPGSTLDLSPSFKTMRYFADSDGPWATLFGTVGLVPIAAMLVSLRRACWALLPQVAVYGFVATTFALSSGAISPGVYIWGALSLMSFLTFVCWSFLAGQ